MNEKPWTEDPWDPARPDDDSDVDGILPDLRRYSRQILIGLAAVAFVFIAWAGWQVRSIANQADTPEAAVDAPDNEVRSEEPHV